MRKLCPPNQKLWKWSVPLRPGTYPPFRYLSINIVFLASVFILHLSISQALANKSLVHFFVHISVFSSFTFSFLFHLLFPLLPSLFSFTFSFLFYLFHLSFSLLQIVNHVFLVYFEPILYLIPLSLSNINLAIFLLFHVLYLT